MSKILIDHEAAKKFAPECSCLFAGTPHDNLAQAYLDLAHQLAAERARVTALAELVESAYMEANKKWQLDETGKWNEQLEQAFKYMFNAADAKNKLTAIMEGRDNG